MFYVFLRQFIVAYKNWKPINSGWLSEDALPSVENLSTSDYTVGCSSGHPAEIILKLSEEVKQLTSLIVECKLIYLYQFDDAFDISLLYLFLMNLLFIS